MSRSLRVGWIGLGAMGAPMALAAAASGHQVKAFDVNPAALKALASRVSPAASARAAAQEAELVVIMVATASQLEDLLFGPEGISTVMTADSTVMVMSTVGPQALEAAAARLKPVTGHLVDAPVSGGVARAATGDLLVMVGGAAADIDRAEPLLAALASTYPTVGQKVGDGQRFKLVNQLLCGVHIAAAAEALALADSMGLDLEQCHQVLKAGAAQSFMFEDRGQRMLAGTFDQAKSALNIFVKDMGLVTDAARKVEQPVPLASAAEQLYLRGRREGLGSLDDSVIYRMLTRRDA